MTYRVELIPSEEGYAVSVPDLPGCHSQGETEDEALANIRSAIHDYVEVQKNMESKKIVRFVDVGSAPSQTRFRVTPVDLKWPEELKQTDSVADWLEYLDRNEAANAQ